MAVEVGQLYHPPWLDALRRPTLGGLVLGWGFLWSDVLCYLVGVLVGYVAERGWLARPRQGAEARARRLSAAPSQGQLK